MMTWTFCTLDESSLLPFMFDLVDTDKSGKMSGKELVAFIKNIYGTRFSVVNSVQKIVREIKENQEFSIEDFINFMRSHKDLASPIFHLQNALREKICGVSYWKAKAKERHSIPPNDVSASLESAQLILRNHGNIYKSNRKICKFLF